jgi:hypothetical protein
MPFARSKPCNTLFTVNLQKIHGIISTSVECQRGRKLRDLVPQTRKALPAVPSEGATAADLEKKVSGGGR